MIKLSRKLEYTLIALKHLSSKVHQEGSLTSAKELTLRYAIPFDAVSRVLQVLAQNNVVKSVQGVHGGYYLTASLNKISLKDLMEYIDGPMSLAKCLSHEDGCEFQSMCNIASPVHILNEKVKDFYATLTLDQLFVSEPPELLTIKESSEAIL